VALVGDLRILLTGDATQLNQTLTGVSRKMQTVGSDLQRIGANMTRGITYPLVGLMVPLLAASGALPVLREELKKVSAELKDALNPMMERLIANLRPLIHSIAELARAFGQLNPALQDSIVKIGIFLAALGPTLSILGRLTKVISAVTAGARTVATVLANIGVSIGTVTATTSGLVGLGLAIAGIVTAFANWGQIPGLIGGAARGVRDFVRDVQQSFDAAFFKTLDDARAAIDKLLHPEQKPSNIFSRMGGADVGASEFTKYLQENMVTPAEQAAKDVRAKMAEMARFFWAAWDLMFPRRGKGKQYELIPDPKLDPLSKYVKGVVDVSTKEMDEYVKTMNEAWAGLGKKPPIDWENMQFDKILTDAEVFSRDIKDAMTGWIDEASSAIVDFCMGVEDAFKNMVNSILRELARIGVRAMIVEPLARSIFGEAAVPRQTTPLPQGYGQGQGVTVNLHNYSGADVSVTPKTTSGGGKALDIVVGQRVRKGVLTGEWDGAFGSAYGMRRVPVGR
jgi:hypothetical protein